ncbi:MAG TPA: FliI/YscN family ATPase [Thermodesulforhabdus norvegica]|uniref:FliI/YscN family ATPase n=1 Tax=Thermodesulforhabdus norvegica TaxID=39841 RepID=A0A7C1B159_9BACT|nr:FliI/YscN family ATPase [Deltaproteobacteria bacterium]MBW2068624.1 FliI/YscN family ATPase [Deltaproteobacteria bacterium]HDL89761.1 FliI/YscN family ATPase [Thermodesulforhabdus norvegica]
MEVREAKVEDYLKLWDLIKVVKKVTPYVKYGKVVRVVGNLIEVEGLNCALGELCSVYLDDGSSDVIVGEVVGFQNKRMKLSPLSPLRGIRPGCLVRRYESSHTFAVSDGLIGRVLDAMGQPLDGKGPIPVDGVPYPLKGTSVNPLTRPLIRHQLDVGIRAINGLLPIGKGQRVGIFAGSGVGKSTLLGMMARYTSADVNVIALIGERGREVREFIERELGEDGMKHSVVIVATSDQPATLRMRGAYLACAVAEYFRDRGMDVLLMMDSITRFAMAAREVGLAAGEPPTSKGYTPSVFSALPELLERAGNFEMGSITGLYTVLVEGDDLDDPIADTVRSILDGHIVLDRNLAQNRHYPAIDVLKSVSRLTDQLLDEEHKQLAKRFIEVLAQYRRNEDMIRIGAYVKGTNPETDYAINMIDKLNAYLRQPIEERCTIEEARAMLKALFE